MRQERQYSRAGKALVADLADVGLLAGVRADMSDEMVGAIIMTPAEATLEVASLF